MANKGSPAKQKYDAMYNKRPEEKKKRAKRNAARAAYEKANGPLPHDVDIDHKRPMRKGGSNTKGNLTVKSQTANRGWRSGKKGYDQ